LQYARAGSTRAARARPQRVARPAFATAGFANYEIVSYPVAAKKSIRTIPEADYLHSCFATMSYATMPATPLRLASLLDRGAWLQGDNLIIEAREDGGYASISFAAHLLEAKKIALALQAAGVRRGDRVATCCWNTNRHLQLYHAVPCLGAVLHPLNIRLGPEEQSYIIGHADDRVLFVDEDLLARVADCDVVALARLKLVVVTNEDSRPVAPASLLGNLVHAGCRVVNMAQFLAPFNTAEGERQARVYQWPEDIPEDHPSGMCYTSGEWRSTLHAYIIAIVRACSGRYRPS
jgi:fatty-acyl-CoA synthase